jgi:hypothetical protein
MNDSLLPQIPGAVPAGALPQAIMPQVAPVPRPPGRPAEDPIKQEERAARHVNRKRVESVLPQRAKDYKILIYRKVAGRIQPGRKPVLTVLLTDLEAAKESGLDTDEYLQDRLIEKYGEAAVGTYECATVDARNNALNEIPKFELLVGSGEDPDEGDDGDDEEEPTEEELRRLEQLEREERMQAGATQAPVQATQATQGLPPVDPLRFDELGRRNRDEAKAEAQSSTALLMQVMLQAQQQQQAAQAQQMQMFMAMMEKHQAPKSNTGELIAALAPIVAPILAKMLDKSPDPLLLKLMEQPKNNVAETMLQTIPNILGKVAEQQMSLQHQGADQAIKMATANAAINAENQAKINGLMMGHLTDTLKSVLNQATEMKKAKGEEDDKGGGLMETIGKVAAAVLPQIMGPQQPAPQENYEQPQAALPAPAPARVPARRAPPPPAAAPAQPPPPPRAAPRDANSKIRGLLAAVADLRSGKIPADQRWNVTRFILNNAPPPMLAAIKADSFEGVLAAGSDAVMASPPLLQWLAEEANQAFLKDVLEDARKLSVGPLDDTYMARKVTDLQALHGQGAPAARVRKPKQTPPGAGAPSAGTSTPETPPPAGTSTPETPPPAGTPGSSTESPKPGG